MPEKIEDLRKSNTNCTNCASCLLAGITKRKPYCLKRKFPILNPEVGGCSDWQLGVVKTNLRGNKDEKSP